MPSMIKCGLLTILYAFLMQTTEGYYPLTPYGTKCDDECRWYASGGYYYCNVGWSWSYCSPFKGVTSSGQNCKADHECDFHGYSYRWCYREDNLWDYCSINKYDQAPIVSSTYKEFCLNKCEQRGFKYYSCKTPLGWDFCAPQSEMSHLENECKGICYDSGKGYKCEVGGGKQEYCSVILDCSYWPGESHGEVTLFADKKYLRLQPWSEKNRCLKVEAGNNRVLNVTQEQNLGISKRYRSPTDRRAVVEILNIFFSRNRTETFNIPSNAQYPTTLVQTKSLRIDLESVNMNHITGVIRANIQIRVNIRPPFGESTTIAKLVIPTDTNFPPRYVFNALYQSYLDSYSSVMDYSPY